MFYRFDNSAAPSYQPDMVFLGVDPDTGREVGLPTERHVTVLAGSGSGKGAALCIPNARRYAGNVLAIDPKGEISEKSYKAREAMGQLVGVIDPMRAAKVPERLLMSFNPLAGILPSSRTGRADLRVVADGCVMQPNAEHAEWYEGAKTIIAGMAGFVITTMPEADRTLATVYDLLMSPRATLEAIAGEMQDRTEFGGIVRAAGNTIQSALETDKGLPPQLLEGARRNLEWVADDAMKDALGSSSFDMTDLKAGRASLFLVLEPRYLKEYSRFLRLLVRCALNTMMAVEGNNRTLFILDEFFSLGRIDEIAVAAGQMRSYGLTLMPFLQDLPQLQELYGERTTTAFFSNADGHVLFGIDQDPVTLEWASRRFGDVEAHEVAAPPPTSVTPVRDVEEKGFFGDRRWARFMEDDKAYKSRVQVEDENARRLAQKRDADKRAAYDHSMRRAGTRRMNHQDIAELTAKEAYNKPSRSMIVFAPGGKKWNLLLAPYFDDVSSTLTARQPSWQGAGVPLGERIAWGAAGFVGGILGAVGLGRYSRPVGTQIGNALIFWLSVRDLDKKLLGGAAVFFMTAETVSKIPSVAAPLFWLSVLAATIFLPPILLRRYGTDWLLIAAFVFGFLGGLRPQQADAPITAGYPLFVSGIIWASLFTAFAWVMRYSWRLFRTS